MPELPEVEALRSRISERFAGKKLKAVEIFWPRLVKPTPARGFAKALVGRRLRSVERRGKYMILNCGEACVLAHLRLDGAFLEPRSENERLDAVFHFANGTPGFRDPRHLARLRLCTHAELDQLPALARLGPEPIAANFTLARFGEIVSRSRTPIKILLMDQRRIAGLGNIYATEALFRAGLHPACPADQLRQEELRRLHRAVVAVTRDAIEWCARELCDLRSIDRWFVGLEKFVQVYGREGEPCRRCREPIQAIHLGGRSSYFCPRCQLRLRGSERRARGRNAGEKD